MMKCVEFSVNYSVMYTVLTVHLKVKNYAIHDITVQFFTVFGPRFIKLCGTNCSLQCNFLSDDILLRSGDIHDQSPPNFRGMAQNSGN